MKLPDLEPSRSNPLCKSLSLHSSHGVHANIPNKKSPGLSVPQPYLR